MRYYLGLDNGGTNTKAALFTPDGTQVAVESVATAALTPAPGFVERDMRTTARGNTQSNGARTARRNGRFPSPASTSWRASR